MEEKSMVLPDQSFDSLPRSYKNRFPFRICAPSFIYPADWGTNIRMLGPYVDEIEILIFDSAGKGDLPTEKEIGQMVTLADEYQLRYNIHLPTDVSLGSPNADCRRCAVDTMIQAVELTRPLNPTAWVLHLSSDESDMGKTEMNRWQKRLEKSVEAIMMSGIAGQSLSVENLNYPLEWVRPIIERFDLAVCLDVGHLMGQEIDWQTEYKKWDDRINMVHLQGVRGHQDHCALDALSQSTLAKILATLTPFTGTVSVEVFSFADLKKSLSHLEIYWQGNR